MPANTTCTTVYVRTLKGAATHAFTTKSELLFRFRNSISMFRVDYDEREFTFDKVLSSP